MIYLCKKTLSNQKNAYLDVILFKFMTWMMGEFKHEVRQFQKPYDNQQAEQISLMV